MSTSIKVNSLEINAFRGIKHLELEFSPRTNVFVGINGVGKTAILDCLTILLSHLINQITSIEEHLYKDSDIYNGANETQNKITISIDEREARWTSLIRKNGIQISSSLEENLLNGKHYQMKTGNLIGIIFKNQKR